MADQNRWEQGGAVPLLFQVQVGSVPVSGLQPTVEMIRYPDYWVADWASGVFVAPCAAASGRALMAQVPSGDGGLYVREFNRASFSETGNRTVYIARYRATIPSGALSSVTEDTEVSTHETHVFELDAGLFASFSN